MRAGAIITDVVVHLSPAEAERLRAEIGALVLNGGTALERLYVELRETLNRAESTA